MKKVLSLVLTLSLVLGTFSMAFAANTSFSDVKGEACEQAVAVLTDLGVANGYEDGTYKPENIVTRAEMAVFVVNALGLEDYVTETATSSFTDMDGYGWAQGYIAYAQSLGVVSGYGDGTFKPGKTVSYDEAATMVVAALGYTTESLQGTWPANFVTKAKSLGILDGIKSGAAGANRGDIAIMLFQTLDQAIGKVNKDGDWVGTGIKFDSKGNAIEWDTMLSRLGASLYEPAVYVDEDDDSFVLTNDIADDAVANVRAYIGAVVSAYANDDNEIIAIKEVFSDFVTGTYDSDDETFTTTDDVEYDVVSNKITTGSAFFYNGTEAGKSNSNYEDDVTKLPADTYYTLAVDLSGKKINDVYSIMMWDISDGVQVDADDIADIDSDHKLLGVDFPETDNNEIDLTAFELVGVDSLDDIAADDVVYVYKNLDDKIGRIAVGTETVSGEVTKVSKDETEATINGTVYKYAIEELDNNGASATEATSDKLGVEDEVKAYLDAYGFIYDYDKTAGSADKYAVVLGTDKSESFGSTTFEIKLFLADGSTSTFDVDDDDIAASIITGNAWVGDWATSGDIAGTLIKYGVNKDGEIDAIESVDTDTAVFKEVKSSDKKNVTAKGYWSSKEINSDAVVFTIDTDGDKTDGGDYTLTTKDKVLDSDPVYGWYALDNNKIAAMLLIGFESTEDTYGVLTDWSSATGDLYNYEMYVDGKEVSYQAEDKGSVYGGGDTVGLFKLKFNSAGEISSLEANFVTDDSDAAKISTLSGITSKSAIDVSGSTVTWKNATIGGYAASESEVTLDSGVAVYMYDDGDWSIEKKNELKNVEEGDNVYFYHTDDDDYGLVTVVIIEKA